MSSRATIEMERKSKKVRDGISFLLLLLIFFPLLDYGDCKRDMARLVRFLTCAVGSRLTLVISFMMI